MRILQVANVRWFNATAWYALTLARLLRDAGHHCPVLVLPGTETHQKALEWGLDAVPMDLNTVNPLRLPGLYARLRGLVRRGRFQVVDCHRGEAFVLFGLLKNRHGYSLIRTRGDQRPPKANLPNAWLHRRAADAVVATNSRTMAQLRQAFGLGPDRLRMIPGGVDTDAFTFDPDGRRRVRAEFGYDDSQVVFGLLGRFDEVKGQEQCIRAVARLARGGLPARLLLIGFETATSEAEVRSWIARENAPDDALNVVRITGLRPDVAACVSACDVGVVPSLWSETIARAALEMMACGLPVVGSDVGVMPDLVSAEALAAPGDVDALETLLARCATDSHWLSARLAEQQAAMPSLTLKSFLEKTILLYREMLGEPGP